MTAMTVDEQHMKLSFISEDEIFFEVVNSGYESDGFNLDNKHYTRLIKNKDMFLVVHAEECLRFEERNNTQRRKEECQFKICCCQNSSTSTGTAVILTVCLRNGENRIIYCRDNKEGKGVYHKKQSPDLWNELERRLWVRPHHLTSVPNLTNALAAEWKRILATMLQNLVECLPRIVEAVIVAKDLPLPTVLESETVFYLHSIKEESKSFRIQSSKWPNLFLGYDDAEEVPVKLVLIEAKKAGKDVVEGLQLVEA